MVKALCIREHKSPIHFHMCTLDAMESSLTCKYNRVKSGKFGHRVNSDADLQTVIIKDETAPYEPSHQDFHCLLR